MTAMTLSVAGCLGSGDDTPNGDGPGNGTGDDGADDGTGNGTDDSTSNGRGDYHDELTLAGHGTDAFRDWLIPEGVVDVEDRVFVCEYLDFDAAAAAEVELFQSVREDAAGIYDIAPTDIAAELVVQIPQLEQTGIIYPGEYDTEAVIDALTTGEQTVLQEYRDFTILGLDDGETPTPTAAVGPDAILETTAAAGHIDARAGEHERLDEADADIDLVLDLLPAGIRTGIRYHHDRPALDVSGEVHTAYNGEAASESIRAFVFDSAAEATVDNAREVMNDGAGFEEILTGEAHARVVMVEYRP